MNHLVPVFALNLAVLTVYMLLQWLGSLRYRDASLVDRYWGGGFVIVAASTFLYSGYDSFRDGLLLGLTAIWGLRLSAYLTWRNWGTGEDYRYAAMREKHGGRFPVVSFFSVFALQGLLTWFISMPLQVGIAAPEPASFRWLDGLGIVLWLTGFAFESLGDFQLARFKANPANKGEVMDKGLWRYTRHPNYFGDALVWWGLYAIAASTAIGAYTILSPLLMHVFLVRVSGVKLLEKKLKRTRPKYAAYVERTNAFYPWFPKHEPASE